MPPIPTSAEAFLSSLRTFDLRCSVCLEPFGSNHDPTAFPCGHVFGIDCVREWVSSNNPNRSKCPVCRTALFTELFVAEEDEDEGDRPIMQMVYHGINITVQGNVAPSLNLGEVRAATRQHWSAFKNLWESEAELCHELWRAVDSHGLANAHFANPELTIDLLISMRQTIEYFLMKHGFDPHGPWGCYFASAFPPNSIWEECDDHLSRPLWQLVATMMRMSGLIPMPINANTALVMSRCNDQLSSWVDFIGFHTLNQAVLDFSPSALPILHVVTMLLVHFPEDFICRRMADLGWDVETRPSTLFFALAEGVKEKLEHLSEKDLEAIRQLTAPNDLIHNLWRTPGGLTRQMAHG